MTKSLSQFGAAALTAATCAMLPASLSAHDIGLKDLIESAALLRGLPKVDLITVSIGPVGGLTMELTTEVQASLTEVVSRVRGLLGIC